MEPYQGPEANMPLDPAPILVQWVRSIKGVIVKVVYRKGVSATHGRLTANVLHESFSSIKIFKQFITKVKLDWVMFLKFN